MSVTWANWFDFDRGTSRSTNTVASKMVATNDKAEVEVEEKNITNKNVFGEAASLELSDGFVAEKKAYSPAMLMESKAAARTLKVGCKGDDVKRLQENLNTLGFNTGKPDGIFGDGTKKAVIAFQKSKGLTADGIVGAGTQNAITRAINEKNAANNGVLKVGSRGSRVTNLQNSLNALGYNAGKADGIFGTGTQNEVIRFQKTYGLTADGQVGSNTESAINKALNYKKNNILSKGQVSNDVKNLQNDLKTLGYLTGNADGAFGAGTEAAVKAFQQKHGLTADGLAGSSTRAKIADAIAEKNKPKPESNVLKLGSKGENVRTLQNNLNALGYNAGTADGQFGNNTQTAVTKFQKTYGLTADGQAGPNTLNAINQTIKYKNQKILSKGQISEDVRTLQSNLKKLGYLSGSADGVFGAGTEAAVKAFQKKNGLTDDGLVGNKTKEEIALAINKKTQSTDTSSSVLKLGSSGENVKQLQSDLQKIGYKITDSQGVYGESTYTAVKVFQNAVGLDNDGIVGVNTKRELSKAVKYADQGKISRGHSGAKVENLQNELKSAGFLSTAVNKVFDAFTLTACAKGLEELDKQTNSPYAGATKAVNDILAQALRNVVIEKEDSNKIFEVGKSFTKQNEGCRLSPYNNGQTIGYGIDIKNYPDLKINYQNDGSITQEEADRIFDIVYQSKINEIKDYARDKGYKLDDYQLISAADLVYNRNLNGMTKEVIDAMGKNDDDKVKQLLSDNFDYKYAMKYLFNNDSEKSKKYVDNHINGFTKRRNDEIAIAVDKKLTY